MLCKNIYLYKQADLIENRNFVVNLLSLEIVIYLIFFNVVSFVTNVQNI